MDYFTPVKDAQVNQKGTRTAAQSREGDWVCLNCSNLNFSFRKKCNRCKTQTRELNETSSAFSYYYYPKTYVYLPLPAEHKQPSRTPTSANSDPHSNSLHNQENCTPPKHNKELPSVSPLVKKYNSRDSALSESSKNSRESMWGVRDFEDVLAGSGRSDEGERDD